MPEGPEPGQGHRRDQEDDRGAPALSGLQAGPADDREAAKLRWRCRRGMRELDVLLLRYLEQEYPSAAATEREAFVRILELQDPELFGYLVGRTTPEDDAVRHVIARIRRDR